MRKMGGNMRERGKAACGGPRGLRGGGMRSSNAPAGREKCCPLWTGGQRFSRWSGLFRRHGFLRPPRAGKSQRMAFLRAV
ncbi:hypothetical protein HMPREF0262_03452 [Clostridium sp. ATCC 29733]|nr:hypothetical protein HMPREF0262_03452 [Clostridium sp. ATCC 29733]